MNDDYEIIFEILFWIAVGALVLFALAGHPGAAVLIVGAVIAVFLILGAAG